MSGAGKKGVVTRTKTRLMLQGKKERRTKS